MQLFSQCFGAVTIWLSIISAVSARPSSSNPLTPSKTSITWSNCSQADPPGLQCGQLSVPLDYSKPDGDTIVVGMARLNASSNSSLGSLIYNNGGPGGVASRVVILAAQGVPLFSADLVSGYDLIGLDPRGVGLSTPIKCDPAIWNQRVDSFPKDNSSLAALISKNKALGASCANLTGPLIQHLDTVNVAKDMELVRAALGDHKLNYLGQSYGTQIGAAYAELYPENINRMALDAIVDHSQAEISTLNSETTTYELTLNQFFQWCNTTTNCTLHGQDVGTLFDSLVEMADKTPIPAPGCSSTGPNVCRSDVNGEEILYNVQGYLAGVMQSLVFPGWDSLSQAISEALHGNATLFSASLATEETFELYPTVAVGCQDWYRSNGTLQDIAFKTQMGTVTAPHTKGVSQFSNIGASCIEWPAPVTNPQHTLDPKVANSPPVLLLNALYDPATSIVWANGVREQWPGSVLVTRNGSGHTSYQLFGEATMVIDKFLLGGVLPPTGSIVNS